MNHTRCYKEGYPRPQFVRDDFLSLDGEWDFTFDDGDVGERNGYPDGDFDGVRIRVPFAYECPASGIGVETMHKHVWYRREIDVGEISETLLNFEGSDYLTKVWINGRKVGENCGGYHRFTFPVGDYLKKGKNVLVVKVSDDYASERPRGKQRWQDGTFGCWYVQTTGIYKSVWLERVGKYYINSVKITPDVNNISVRFDYTVSGFKRDGADKISKEIGTYSGGFLDGLLFEAEITYKGKPVSTVSAAVTEGTNTLTASLCSDSVSFKYALWSPENPELYDVVFRLRSESGIFDTAGSYFGLRSIETKNGRILLNECPVTLKMVLDQGYFADSHLTAPSEKALSRDVALIKEMGFNGARKHQKTEDDRFLYYADTMGLLVWVEMPSSYRYSDAAIQETVSEWGRIVSQFCSHPSVMAWVPLNESWGVPTIATNKAQQNFASALYYYTKSFDPFRPVVSNDGWEHTLSDILTIHHYEQNAEKLGAFYDTREKATDGFTKNRQKLPYADGWKYGGQPIIFSEYGGTALASDTKDGWGYGNAVKNGDELLERYEALTGALADNEYCAGFCYTQLTDVQQEVNGLLTIDRKPKVDIKKIKDINDRF